MINFCLSNRESRAVRSGLSHVTSQALFFSQMLLLIGAPFIAVAEPSVAAVTESKVGQAGVGKSSPLSLLLSQRHGQANREDCEQAAGSVEAAVKELASLRLSKNPLLAYKAQKVLLQFSDITEVADILESDITSLERRGLAGIIAANLNLVTEKSLRRRLGSKIVSVEKNSNHRPLSRLLVKGDYD